MLTEMIQERIQFAEKTDNWQDAIRMTMEPLLKEGFITQQYIDATIESVIKNGPYIIIIPGFAMPHTRPENGALKTGMAFLKLEKPAVFPDGSEVNLFLALAAGDSNAHLDAMAELTDILIDEELMEQLFQAKEVEEIKAVLK